MSLMVIYIVDYLTLFVRQATPLLSDNINSVVDIVYSSVLDGICNEIYLLQMSFLKDTDTLSLQMNHARIFSK